MYGRTDNLSENSDHYWSGLWSASWINKLSQFSDPPGSVHEVVASLYVQTQHVKTIAIYLDGDWWVNMFSNKVWQIYIVTHQALYKLVLFSELKYKRIDE